MVVANMASGYWWNRSNNDIS